MNPAKRKKLLRKSVKDENFTVKIKTDITELFSEEITDTEYLKQKLMDAIKNPVTVESQPQPEPVVATHEPVEKPVVEPTPEPVVEPVSPPVQNTSTRKKKSSV